jgi:hypothetical protein
MARLAADHDPPLEARYWNDTAQDNDLFPGKSRSQWMVLARCESDLGKMAKNPYWEKVRIVPGPIWRDDFANLLRVWKKPEEN